MAKPYEGDSTSANIPGIKGTNTALAGSGVFGESQQGDGVDGVSESNSSAGVRGANNSGGPGVSGTTNAGGPGVSGVSSGGGIGVSGAATASDGVQGQSQSSQHSGVAGINNSGGPGVYGSASAWDGVHGESQSNQHAGVSGINGSGGPGVYGSASAWDGVHGESQSNQHAGVSGINGSGGPGVYGSAGASDGVYGQSQSSQHSGVSGFNGSGGPGVSGTGNGGGPGVSGSANAWDGVHGESQSSQHAGVSAVNTAGGYGLWARATTAGHFEGDVEVFGSVHVKGNGDITFGDCAEQFDVSPQLIVEPGTVMVIIGEGELEPSQLPYDKKVAGVISGAGNLRPAIILDKQQSDQSRASVALVGKVYCKVDASYAPVEIGDLLTTSPTPGHAMTATDQFKAFGAVIGKALRPLGEGQELIPILIALQ